VTAPRLELGEGLSLPLDVVTRAGIITGQRGQGKTSTAVVEVEEVDKAGAPSVIIDPTDAWWGLRSSASGKGPGLRHVVFGGEHGHLPLNPEAGPVMARLIAERRLPAVLSLKEFRKGAQLRFVAEFLEELYHVNREALLVVVDEAHRFAPAKLPPSESGGWGGRCLGAVVDAVTLGRKDGIGVRLITQRMARLHADARESCELMVVHRLMGSLDRKAVDGWLEDMDEDGRATALAKRLPHLERGHALYYAPGLRILGEFTIRPKRTFDSSKTPEVGAAKIEPASVREIDLSAIEVLIGETIEKAREDDPKALKAEVAKLRKQIGDHVVSTGVPQEVVDEMMAASEAERVERERQMTVVAERVREFQYQWAQLFGEILSALAETARPVSAEEPRIPSDGDRSPRKAHLKTSAEPVAQTNGGDAQQRVLDALAWLEVAKVKPASRLQIAMVAGYHPRTNAFTAALSQLAGDGLVEFPRPSMVELRMMGANRATWPEQAPQSDLQLQTMILNQVGGVRADALRVLLQTPHEPMSRNDLATALTYHPRTNAYTKALGSLKELGLIKFPRPGWVQPSDAMFLSGR
jgi:hypothetical protein